MNRKRFFLGFAAIILASLTILFFSMGPTRELLRQFKSFSVTVDNQSDYDVNSIEIGLTKRDSTDIRNSTIKSGQKKKIKPDLKLSGEGSIYLKFTDSRGQATEETICSYTEYLSGYSKVTIYNDRTTVVEQCN